MLFIYIQIQFYFRDNGGLNKSWFAEREAKVACPTIDLTVLMNWT